MSISIGSVVAICITAALLSALLKNQRPEISLILIIAAGCGILAVAVCSIMPILETIEDFSDKLGDVSGYLKLIIKALGICYLAQFGSDVCKDAGESSLASKIELSAKITVVAISLPMIKDIIETVLELL